MEDKQLLEVSYIHDLSLKIHQISAGWRIPVTFRATRDSVFYLVDITSVDDGFKEDLKSSYRKLNLEIENTVKNELRLSVDMSNYLCLDSCDYSCLEIMYSGAILKYFKKTGGRLAMVKVCGDRFILRSTENEKLDDPYELEADIDSAWPELVEIGEIVKSLGVVKLVRRCCEGDTYADYSNLYYPVKTLSGDIIIFV